MMKTGYLARRVRAMRSDASQLVFRKTSEGVAGALLAVIRAAESYLRVEVEGWENIPARGRVLVAPNHSGCAGYDAAIICHLLHERLGRVPRILTLWKMFELFPPLGRIARTMGCVPARQEEGTRVLQKGGMLVVFPEGEGGSFKPSSEAYRLQPFRPGLVRLAARTRAPIVPCIITGAEETHVNLGQIKLARVLPGLKFPIPLNLLAPLPAKWRIRFLPPVRLEAIAPSDVQEDLAGETELSEAAVFQLCEALRVRHQSALDHELATRPYVFFDSASSRPKQSAEPSC